MEKSSRQKLDMTRFKIRVTFECKVCEKIISHLNECLGHIQYDFLTAYLLTFQENIGLHGFIFTIDGQNGS